MLNNMYIYVYLVTTQFSSPVIYYFCIPYILILKFK